MRASGPTGFVYSAFRIPNYEFQNLPRPPLRGGGRRVIINHSMPFVFRRQKGEIALTQQRPALRAVCAALALVLLALTLTGCGGKKSEAVTSVAQLNEKGRKVGVASDTAEDRLVAQELPQAQIEYFNEEYSAYTSVSQGKIDAFVFNRMSLESAIHFGMKGVRVLDETLGEGNTSGVAFSPVTKIPELEDKVNAFLREIKADGTLDDMARRWLVQHEETMPDIPVPEQSDVHLVVGTTGVNTPFTYYAGTELVGYDIELARRFAAWLGATLEFKIYGYDGIVAAAQSGDVDCIFANLFITPERSEALRFSEPTFVGEIGVLVRDPDASSAEAPAAPARWQDYNGARLGVLVGPPMENVAAEFFPDSEYLLFDSYPDCIAALLTGKIDAYLSDEPGVKSARAENPEIDYIPERLTENNYSFAFRKDDPESAALCEELNGFLARCRADGTLQELEDIWLGVDEAKKVVDMSGLTGENGKIRVVTTSEDMPWSYIKDGKNVGYDIDLVVRFCRARGYALELGDVDFAGRIPAVQSGKYDFTTDMNVTPEREEQVLFSDPTSQGGIVLAVRASQTASAAAVTLKDLEHAAVGVLTGSNLPEIVGAHLPEAEVRYFNTTADELSALRSGKVDALALDEPVARNMAAEDGSLAIVPEKLGVMDYAFVLGKSARSEALCAEISDYLRGLKADGTLEALQKKWFDAADFERLDMTDYRDLPAVNGTVRLATFQYPPFSVEAEEMSVGYEIELMAMFCRDRGYALTVTDMTIDAILPSVQSGKFDVGCGSISVTEERKQTMLFTEPDYTGGTALLVRAGAQESGKGGFFAGLAESFEKTFLRENRWKLFLEGIGTTMLITVLSVVLGTLLGFGVFLLCRRGNVVANTVTRFFVWLVHGMPEVVLLMILYYIIFGRAAVSGTLVSVIGFTLIFGAAVFSMVRSGVGAIGRGQTEAALALGYSDRRAFFRVVLPQALPHFMPAYKGEITALIKATAIVGYVAVQDLTKMGDIVRSRTYEAFFPLIAVAAIYFVLAAILTFLVNRIELRIDPRRRSRSSILKGVDVK